MKVKVMPRCSGKTTLCIERSHETGYPILVGNSIQADLVKHHAKRMELDIPEPIHVTSPNFKKKIANRKVIIDDAGIVLGYLLGTKVELATVELRREL